MRKIKVIEALRNRFRRVWGYLIWALIILFSVSTIRNVGKITRIKSDIESEKERVAKIQAQNDELKDKVARSQTVEFIEREIRDKLGLVKEGESVVILPDIETLRRLAPNLTREAETLPDPNWKKWLKLFL